MTLVLESVLVREEAALQDKVGLEGGAAYKVDLCFESVRIENVIRPLTLEMFAIYGVPVRFSSKTLFERYRRLWGQRIQNFENYVEKGLMTFE